MSANDPQTLDDIQQSLGQLYVTPGEQNAWLRTPNMLLDNVTPEQLIRAGDADRVLDVLNALLTGAFL